MPFVGAWSFVQDTSFGLQGGSQDFHTSNSSGDYVSHIFNGKEISLRLMAHALTTLFLGSAITISGYRDYASGSYSVTLDGNVSTYDAQSSFEAPATLFFATGLSAGVTHNLTIINLEDRLLAVGSLNVTTLQGTSP